MPYDFTNTFTDQEGLVWDMDYGKCPLCGSASKLSHRESVGGYFNCPDCHLMYDEPHWHPPVEDAFITCISDDDARDDADPEVRRRWAEYHGVHPYG